eukprot:CAMPEP_0201531898 /NCGR_PEP_ID=MMETSP0161_2-20130828/48910_1 /ASSEMBLY_ACC=CAM_ASM_000251 /TAXON_ID=180227 /ORGANISM="Neoparamoeba aestuarina, Strain SoJaBio B1-5/56/2" /LENGTH=62 /DNA_ID=CAMNT_0047935033 /DNA_START=44 /DNA_END=228 /DNA_ORIENTATION=+
MSGMPSALLRMSDLNFVAFDEEVKKNVNSIQSFNAKFQHEPQGVKLERFDDEDLKNILPSQM